MIDKNLRNDLFELKPLLLKLLEQKDYISVLENIHKACERYMLPKTHYDRYLITPYSMEVSQRYDIEYVNASFVNIDGQSYIACQEPKLQYEQRFLDFICKSGINTVVVLKDNCKYLKNEIPVFSSEINEQNGIVIKNEVYLINSKEIRFITCPSWPDHSIISFENLNFLSDYVSKYEKGPMIVHCKAGVGRTGTFIMYNLLKNKKNMFASVFLDYFIDLRLCRPLMVQSASQLKLLFENFVMEEN